MRYECILELTRGWQRQFLSSGEGKNITKNSPESIGVLFSPSHFYCACMWKSHLAPHHPSFLLWFPGTWFGASLSSFKSLSSLLPLCLLSPMQVRKFPWWGGDGWRETWEATGNSEDGCELRRGTKKYEIKLLSSLSYINSLYGILFAIELNLFPFKGCSSQSMLLINSCWWPWPPGLREEFIFWAN